MHLRLGSSPHSRGTREEDYIRMSRSRIIPAFAGNTASSLFPAGECRDHPRIRGEHVMTAFLNVGIAGSSPHSRGTLVPLQSKATQERIIPAFAGNTHNTRKPCRAHKDHPRIRGEHRFDARLAPQRRGSSPHSRGTHFRLNWQIKREGIIPAFEGNTRPEETLKLCSWDHPRIRGEHSTSSTMRAESWGSSPHSRGTLCDLYQNGYNRGIIPAFAGNTWSSYSARYTARDHPRIRGEHRTPTISLSCVSGSSPHSRGTQISDVSSMTLARIIPAFAGNTPQGLRHPFRRWDHPRIRGEHKFGTLSKKKTSGSSPHSRGTLQKAIWYINRSRIIPAFAGNTSKGQNLRMRRWDHPRIRGEHERTSAYGDMNEGSSPHSRGTRVLHRRRLRAFGIIPAFAGNTAFCAPQAKRC